MNIAYVLLSGGLDSSTCLYLALREYPQKQVRAVSIDYGQRHAKELDYASQICGIAGVKHQVIRLDRIVPRTMLTDTKQDVPDISYDEIKGVSPTYVPFRNGLMLSALASLVHGTACLEDSKDNKDEWAIYFGAHSEDAKNWAYPDCTPEFIGAMANAIWVGTYQKVRLHTPLMWLRKSEIVKLGDSIGVPFEFTWSCYKGDKLHCGSCPTCRSRREAFEVAHVDDPTQYET